MQKQIQASAESPESLRAYTPRFVAEAVSLHEETIRDALRSGRLPGVRVGNKWRITHATLVALLQDGLSTKNTNKSGPRCGSGDGRCSPETTETCRRKT